MKNILFTRFSIALIAMAILSVGCSKSNQQAFHKRKYQPFFLKHSGPKVDKAAEEELEIARVFEKAAPEKTITQASSEQTVKASTNEASAILPAVEQTKQPIAKKVQAKIAEKVVAKTLRKLAPQAEVELSNEVVGLEHISDVERNSNSSRDDTELILLLILAIILPPLAVFLLKGLELEFWISLILTLLFWLPGIIYALYLVLKDNGKV